MSQRAIEARLEARLTGRPEPDQSAEARQALPPMETRLLDMVSFEDLEMLLLRGCLSPSNRVAVSHYLRWMCELSPNWKHEDMLLELLAVLAIAIEKPRLGATVT